MMYFIVNMAYHFMKWIQPKKHHYKLARMRMNLLVQKRWGLK